jgi:hypothetical protein
VQARSVFRQLLLLVTSFGLPVVAPANAADFLSPETLSVSGNARLVVSSEASSWITGGWGKLRGSNGTKIEIADLDLVWQPRLSWSTSATVVGTFEGDRHARAGISEAYLTVRPKRAGAVRSSFRAGLMWVPLSLEHSGADWHVRDTITPSAINSWVGEELSPLAVEGTLDARFGDQHLALTAAAIAANDTAGTLLTFRGWALHDRRALAGRKQLLPPLAEELEYVQPRFTHPLLDVGRGFARRPGYYVKLAWEPPLPVRVELLHYDNRANPEAVNADLEWGWRTRFTHLGAVVRAGPTTTVRIQAMDGRARMGLSDTGQIWIDNHFRSAFALVSQEAGPFTLAGRIEAFGTRQHGSLVSNEDAEHGWAATAAVRRRLGENLSAAAEILRVKNNRSAPEETTPAPRPSQTQFQTMIRATW